MSYLKNMEFISNVQHSRYHMGLMVNLAIMKLKTYHQVKVN